MRRAADRDDEENIEDAMAIAALMDAVWTMPQTTIARVNGHAFGGAVGLAACCDMAIAPPRRSSRCPRRGWGSFRARSALCRRRDRRPAGSAVVQTGERFDAATAHAIGLVHQVVGGRVGQAVDGFLAELRKAGPMASRAAKALVAAVDGKEIDAAIRRESAERIARQRASEEDAKVSRLLEKRRPSWMDWGMMGSASNAACCYPTHHANASDRQPGRNRCPGCPNREGHGSA